MRNVDGSLSTKVYRKPTHTDQYLQFSSHHPMAHKPSVVSTLLKRAASHCSLNSLVRKEKAYVKETLHCNGYPEHFLFPLECHRSLGRTQRTRMTLDPVSLSSTFKVFWKQWLGSCQTSMFRSTWSHSGHSGRSFPIQRIASPMMISPMLYIRPIVVTAMPVVLVKQEGHWRPMYWNTAELLRRQISLALLLAHAWENHHHIDWTSTLSFKTVQGSYLHPQAVLFP